MSLISAFVAVTALVAPRPAAAQRPDTIPSDTIIAHYFTAVGGRDKVLAIKSRRMTGAYQQGSLKAQVVILAARPGVRKVFVTGPGVNHAEGYDGTTWSHEFTTGQTVRERGITDVIGRRSAEFDESFVQYAAKRNRVTSLGRGMLDGVPTYGLHVRTPDGDDKDYFFDGKTSLIVAVRQQMKLPNGRTVQTITSYGDWKPVAGVLMPYSFVERNTANGKVVNQTTWSKIEVNVPTTAADFHPPQKGARAG